MLYLYAFVRDLDGVPGRFEIVSTKKDEVTVVVDYAHTDDALRNLLETARPLTGGRLITVFGCGGDRDRTKRPLMGAVAGRLSDLIVITSDNPRSEDPNRIIEEVQRGITPDTPRPLRSGRPESEGRESAPRLLTIVDRGAAIARGIELARPGDVVLVAGELGAGKTTLVRGACRELGVTVPVTSPTFTIGQRYPAQVPVSHIDLFRVDRLSEEEPDLLADYLGPDTIAFVEWPPTGPSEHPSLGRIVRRVRIEYLGGDRRLVEIA